ncbi:hypothetical protein [Dankookia sp. P2]|uniref:hypothetical protein n=1 Tax=Dankookia sp. P2 TaxID=3423955 RepID=UPI003D66D08F
MADIAFLEAIAEDTLEDFADMRSVMADVQRPDDVPAAQYLLVPSGGGGNVRDGKADMGNG